MIKMCDIEKTKNLGLKLVILATLSIALCMMLYYGVELGIVTKHGELNCTSFEIKLEDGVYMDACRTFFRSDMHGI